MHPDFQIMMQRELDGELPADEHRRLQAHVQACTACNLEWASLLRVHQQLSASPVVAARADFAAGVRRRIAVKPRTFRADPSQLMMLALTSASALAVLLVVSPLAEFTHPEEWLEFPQMIVGMLTTVVALAGIVLTILRVIGDAPLVLFAILALALTLFWTRLVSGYSLSRPIFVPGGSQ